MNTKEEEILRLQIEVDTLQAKLDKKREVNHADATLDEEILYSKQLALSKILEEV